MKKILFVLIALLMVGAVMAASVSPVYMEGNPTCEDIGYDNEFKVDPPAEGSWDGISITDIDGSLVDWSSSFPMGAVIIKGGPNANVYYYDTSMEDTDLVTPTNPNNQQPYGLSHVTFCWDDNEIPEFGVVAGVVALIGALAIFGFTKRN
jgi:hypothetical protein